MLWRCCEDHQRSRALELIVIQAKQKKSKNKIAPICLQLFVLFIAIVISRAFREAISTAMLYFRRY